MIPKYPSAFFTCVDVWCNSSLKMIKNFPFCMKMHAYREILIGCFFANSSKKRSCQVVKNQSGTQATRLLVPLWVNWFTYFYLHVYLEYALGQRRYFSLTRSQADAGSAFFRNIYELVNVAKLLQVVVRCAVLCTCVLLGWCGNQTMPQIVSHTVTSAFAFFSEWYHPFIKKETIAWSRIKSIQYVLYTRSWYYLCNERST